MAWWNSYDRGYLGGDYGRGYADRGYGDRGESFGRYRAAPRGMYDEGYRGRYYGGASGWLDGYDYDTGYRGMSPEQSPTYGDQGDRAIRRWARRYGYDEGYEIRPNMGGGGMGMNQGWGSEMGASRGYGMNSPWEPGMRDQGEMRSRGGAGWTRDEDWNTWGSRGGRRNDWGYRW